MQFIIGLIALFGCVLGGFSIHGDVRILWQPVEVMIIFGAGVAAFIIGNPLFIIKDALKALGFLFKGKPYSKKDYMDLLLCIYELFKLIKAKGILIAETHIENPYNSEIFKKYPSILKDKHAVEFFCDSMRLVTTGVDNHYVLGDVLDQEIELQEHEGAIISGAVTTFGDSLPALGIVAAVLGVILTMGSITKPPEVLGELIGAALCGTFQGILLSYGIFSPMGNFIGKFFLGKVEYTKCMKVAIMSYMQGNAPLIILEFVRKNIPPHLRPEFSEMDKAINSK